MAVDAHAEPLRQTVDRPLEPRIVERDEPAALLAEEMVVVLAAGLRALEPRLPVADVDPLDEPVLDEQVEHAVDAGAAGRAAVGAQRVLDLDRAQRARLGSPAGR